MVNRKLEVEELNLRGLSSSDSEQVPELPQAAKQHRVRKLFNSFKEDNIVGSRPDQTDFNPLSRLRSPEVGSKRKRRRLSNKYNRGQNEERGENPILTHHNSMMANINFQPQQDITEMKQRYMTFNTHIQALNRIERLAFENLHLKKMLISSQHDLRLLQRFTKNYFKSMDFFNQKDFNVDQDMQNVLRMCFQEMPVVLMAFSSPLVRRVEDEATQRCFISEMPQLDFNQEFEGAIQGMQESRMAIKIGYV